MFTSWKKIPPYILPLEKAENSYCRVGGKFKLANSSRQVDVCEANPLGTIGRGLGEKFRALSSDESLQPKRLLKLQ